MARVILKPSLLDVREYSRFYTGRFTSRGRAQVGGLLDAREDMDNSQVRENISYNSRDSIL